MKVIGYYNKSVILTYTGVVIAVFGIFAAMQGKVEISAIALIISGICDLFDGPAARKCKNRTDKEKEFGIQIDSLADMIISIALPSVISVSIMNNAKVSPVISVGMTAIYAICGIIRLAYFNINTETDKKTEYYTGLPVTYIALILPAAHMIFGGMEFYGYAVAAMLLIMAMLFILKIRVKKPAGKWYVFFSVLAVVFIIILILRT